MAKALMCIGSTSSIASAQEFNLFGGVNTSEEINAQIKATEACTFSNLGVSVQAGGDGTNTFRFRKNTANGNLVVDVVGATAGEDSTNTDVLAAADVFNVAYTDTGTSPTRYWVKANVNFSSGYGSYIGAANYGGLIFDVESATLFIPLSGALAVDGTATEAHVAFKARGFTTFEAFQVNVVANARINNSVFNGRVAGANVGTITLGAGATGIITTTGLAGTVADGNAINAAITLLSGVEDLTVTAVVATLKSTDTEQDIWTGIQNGVARAASATAHYFPLSGRINAIATFTEAEARIKPGYAGTAKNLRIYVSANTLTGNATLKLFNAGSAVLTTTITAGAANQWFENTADSNTFTDTNQMSYEIVGGTSGSLTIHMIGVTLANTEGGAAAIVIPIFLNQYRSRR